MNNDLQMMHQENNLYTVSRTQIHRAIQICESVKKFKALTDKLQTLLAETADPQVSIAMIGGQSTGKSTFLNNLLQYPVLPTAEDLTSSCPVEIRYGEVPALDVFMVNADGSEQTLVSYSNPLLNDELFLQLKEYALLCFNNNVIALETISYFCDQELYKTDINAPEFTSDLLKMDPKDPRHVITLLFILLSTYVGQNEKNRGTEDHIFVRRERQRLLDEIVPAAQDGKSYAEQDYCLRLWWNSSLLNENLILVDLPGLGSMTDVHFLQEEDSEGPLRLSHSQITTRYAQNADSLFMLFDPQARKDDMDIALRSLLDGERMKQIVDKNSRFVALMNKADSCKGNIFTPAEKIRVILQGIDLPRILPVSGLYGEYLLVKAGGIPVTRTKLYRQHHREEYKKWLRRGYSEERILENEQLLAEDVLIELEENYKTEFAYQVHDNGASKQEMISLERFLNEFIHDFSLRIRYLKILDMLLSSNSHLNGIIKEAELRASVVAMLHQCGPQISSAILNSVFTAVNEALNIFNGELSQISNKLRWNAIASNKRVQQAKQDILSGLEAFESHLSETISITLIYMEKNRSGRRAYLDDTDNEADFLRMLQRLEEANFRNEALVQNSMREMEAVINEQKNIFTDGVNTLKRIYAKLPDLCRMHMAAAFEQQKALADANIRVLKVSDENADIARHELANRWALFEMHYQSISAAVDEHICSVVNMICTRLDSNNGISTVITVTAVKLEDFYRSLDVQYKVACDRILKSCKRTSLFKGKEFVKINKALKRCQKPLVNKLWIAKYMMKLDYILLKTPKAATYVDNASLNPLKVLMRIDSAIAKSMKKCHNDRVMDALSSLEKDGVENTAYIKSCYPEIEASINELSQRTSGELLAELLVLRDECVQPLANTVPAVEACIRNIPEAIHCHPQLSCTIDSALESCQSLASSANKTAAAISNYIDHWEEKNEPAIS